MRLDRMVEAQVARSPGAVAVEFEGRRLSYGELDARAGRLAALLRARGVGRETLVGVCAERSLELVVALLAVLKAGGAYVPLDPEYPEERLRFMVEDSGVRLVLSQGSLPGAGLEVLPLDASDSPPEGERHGGWEPGGEDDLAYVIYTSGSTGRPKGVGNTHGGVCNRLDWAQRTCPLGERDVVLQKTPVSFDVSVWELFWPLTAGARLLLARPGGHRDAGYLRDLIVEGRVTTAHFVPSMLAGFLAEEGVERCASLRRVVCSGEELPPDLAAGLLARLPGCELHNLYGPTEAAIDVSAWRCEAATLAGASRVPIGRPIRNVKLHVLDRWLEPVPSGTAGELYIGGMALARGYLGRPGLTGERFLPDPHGPPGGRLYRTGDLARWTAPAASGSEPVLEYLGRVDRQVKLRGQRIEPGEIEAAARRHPGVEAAAVELRRDEHGEPLLVAYVTGARAPGPAELLGHLAALLPASMLPARACRLGALPLTPSGKLDRGALPLPGLAVEGRAPATRTERVVHDVWCDVLELAAIGTDRDFFELGGHSLHAARILARLASRLGRRLEVRDLFEARTPAALAARFDATAGDVPEAGVAPGPGSPPQVSPGQRQLWLADRLDPGEPTYNVSLGVRLRGPLDVGALDAALGQVVARHRILTARFPGRDGEPALELGTPVPPLAVDVLAPAPDAAAWLEGQAARPFDLASGPLLRARLLRCRPDDHVLALTLHHIVTDGWSTTILLRDLAACYAAARERRPPALPELACQYDQFAARQRALLEGADGRALVARWRERLAGAPLTLELPADRPRPPLQTHAGGRRRTVLPDGVAAAVRAAARAAGASVSMTALAAFSLLLGRLTGQDDLLVGVPVANRRDASVQHLVGYFLNTLPLRADLRGDPTFAALVARTRAALLDVLADDEVPFTRLVEELRAPADLSRSPLVQVVFNTYNFEAPRLDLPGIEAEVLPEPTPGSIFDLTVYLSEREGRLRLDAVYNRDLFDAERVDEMLRQLVGLLGQAAAEPGRRIGALTLVTERARRVLPDPRADLDRTWRGSVPALFEAAAGRAPGACGVLGPGTRWSYADLAERAGGLAALLRRAGAGRGDVVAIVARRTPELVVALLGVLWSGAAFTVLDPAHPSERLAEQVRLCRPRAWIQLGPPPAGPLRRELDGAVHVDLAVPGLPPAPLPDVGPDDLAYVAFTSGSTGRPKGTLGRHGPLTHFLPWLRRRFGLGEADRYSLLSGLAHDPLHRDIFTPLCTGAAVCCPPADVPTAGRPAEWLRAAGVTVAHLTPALGQVVTASPGELPDLRLAFFVGDVLTRRDVVRLRRMAPAVTVVNYYGSTETQRAVGCHVVDPAATGRREIVPLGRGIEDVQLLVLDGAGAMCGVGEPGEVHLRSPHVALGYLGDPELTAARFPADPFGGRPGDRVYRTGDLGRYLPDGEVEPLGRADRQVKVRGHRVELGEVEAVLGRHAAVREAVVTVARGGTGLRLVAYLVPGRPAGDAELRSFLRERVPEYMVPSAFVRVDALPLGPNGKVTLEALPDPAGAEEAVALPRSETERRVAAVWSEVLERPRLGVDQNFFDLGGSSLALVQVQARLERRFGRPVPTLDLVRHPTVSALAAHLDRAAGPDLAEALRRGRARASAVRERRR